MTGRARRRAAGLVAGAALAGAAVAVAIPGPANAALIEVECAGSRTDATTINAAIAGSSEGDEIVFQGTCLIDQTITMLAHRSYRGESRTGTVLRQADGADLDAVLAGETYLDSTPWTGEPLSLRSLTVDGNRDNNTAPTTGVVVRSWLTVVEDLRVRELGGHGIMLSSPGADGTPVTQTTSVNGRIAASFVTNVGGHGIYVNEPADVGGAMTDWNLLDNWVGTTGGSGIYLGNAAGWAIERNHVYDISEHGIFADRLWGSSVSGNLVESFGKTAQAGTWYGIGATVQGWAASAITGNRLVGLGSEANQQSTYRYLGIDQVNYSVGVVSVTGNAIHGAGTARGTGLYYGLGPGDELNVHSSGNMVNNVGTALETDGDPVTVVAGDGAYLDGGDVECTSVMTGPHTGPLTVTSGVTCLEQATVTGPVRVEAGAGLRSSGSRVDGPITAQRASEITFCDTRLTGPVTLTAGAAVTLGDPSSGCAPNTVTGPVRIVDTAGQAVLAGNTITGPLACTGNDPDPVNGGVPNLVTGPQTGQCKDL